MTGLDSRLPFGTVGLRPPEPVLPACDFQDLNELVSVQVLITGFDEAFIEGDGFGDGDAGVVSEAVGDVLLDV